MRPQDRRVQLADMIRAESVLLKAASLRAAARGSPQLATDLGEMAGRLAGIADMVRRGEK